MLARFVRSFVPAVRNLATRSTSSSTALVFTRSAVHQQVNHGPVIFDHLKVTLTNPEVQITQNVTKVAFKGSTDSDQRQDVTVVNKKEEESAQLFIIKKGNDNASVILKTKNLAGEEEHTIGGIAPEDRCENISNITSMNIFAKRVFTDLMLNKSPEQSLNEHGHTVPFEVPFQLKM